MVCLQRDWRLSENRKLYLENHTFDRTMLNSLDSVVHLQHECCWRRRQYKEETVQGPCLTFQIWVENVFWLGLQLFPDIFGNWLNFSVFGYRNKWWPFYLLLYLKIDRSSGNHWEICFPCFSHNHFVPLQRSALPAWICSPPAVWFLQILVTRLLVAWRTTG